MKTDIFKSLSERIKNNKWIAVIFIIGIGLMLLPAEKNTAKSEPQKVSEESFAEYKSNMENDLRKIISDIKGAGKVSVMITLGDNGNTYFATDETDSTSERNGEKSREKQTRHILKSVASNVDEPLVRGKTPPQISGVLICAEGADDAKVKNNIVCAVEALVGVKSHRVEVLERK